MGEREAVEGMAGDSGIDVDELMNGTFLKMEDDGQGVGPLGTSLGEAEQTALSDGDFGLAGLRFIEESDETMMMRLDELVLPRARSSEVSDRRIGQKSKRPAGLPSTAVESCEDGTTEARDVVPRTALKEDLPLVEAPGMSENEYMMVVSQPPLEVRTRTKNENRTFSCTVAIKKLPSSSCKSATVKLCYATDTDTVVDTMGGTLTRPIMDGCVSFSDLNVSVASPKHAEKEFVLCVTLDGGGEVFSTPFYAYSHKSVLKRRREVQIRACSHASVSCKGQDMHVVGLPFVRSDRLQVALRVRSGDLDPVCRAEVQRHLVSANLRDVADDIADDEWVSLLCEGLEFFSDSVLFFRPPAALRVASKDIAAYLQVTNDGRNFSNPLSLVVLADGPPSPKRQCGAIRSRM